MDASELLERYEALGAEADFAAAKRLYEDALVDAPSANVYTEFGYLLECHARNELRRAAELYEQATRLDPNDDKPHYQLISAHAGLQQPEVAVAGYERRLAEAPDQPREHRCLASAYRARVPMPRPSVWRKPACGLRRGMPSCSPCVARPGPAWAIPLVRWPTGTTR